MGRKKKIAKDEAQVEDVVDVLDEVAPEALEAAAEEISLAPKVMRDEFSDLQKHPKFAKFKRGEN